MQDEAVRPAMAPPLAPIGRGEKRVASGLSETCPRRSAAPLDAIRDPALPDSQGAQHSGAVAQIDDASVRRVLRQAWEMDDAERAETLIRNLARRLERDWNGVSASILEGIDPRLRLCVCATRRSRRPRRRTLRRRRLAKRRRLVLDAVGAEDEMGESFVRDDLLTGMAGLGEIDGRRRIFGGGVLVALEGEIDEQPRCRVAAWSAALRRIDDRRDGGELDRDQAAATMKRPIRLFAGGRRRRRRCSANAASRLAPSPRPRVRKPSRADKPGSPVAG